MKQTPQGVLVLLAVILSLHLPYVSSWTPSPPPDFPAMGRQPDSPDKIFALSTANGYKIREHREKDAGPSLYGYVDKTFYDQNCALRYYVM